MHLPQAGQEGLAFGVDDAGACGYLYGGGWADCCDTAVADYYGGVFYCGAAGAVDEACADDGEGSGGFGEHLVVEVGEVEDLLADAAADYLGCGGFVFVEDLFLGQASGEGHEGDEAAGVVHPQDFAAEDEVGDGVAGEAKHLAFDGEGVVADGADLELGGPCRSRE